MACCSTGDCAARGERELLKNFCMDLLDHLVDTTGQRHSRNGEVSATPWLQSRASADPRRRCGNLRCTEPRATSRAYGYLVRVAAAALREARNEWVEGRH